MTTKTAKVTLGGVEVGGDGNYTWPLVDGTSPAEEFWTVSADRVEDFPLGKPLTLKIEGPRKTLEVQYVYVLEVLPARSPKQRVLHLADRRWLWSRIWIGSVFNVRRTTGQTIGLLGEGQALELTEFDPDIEYFKPTLYPPENGSTPWTLKQALDYVFKKLDQPYRTRGVISEVTLLETDLDKNGAAALDTLFSVAASGMTVSLDPDGTAVVRTQLYQGTPRVPTLRKHVVGADMTVSDRRAIRPSKVIVLFDREQEIRFDYNERGSVQRDTPELINVAPVPDLTLTLTSAVNNKKVARGSFVGLQYLFDAWGAFPNTTIVPTLAAVFPDGVLTFAGLARFGFQLSALESFVANGLSFSVTAARRLRASVDNWRKTFQVEERFMQRLASIRAVRCRVLNPLTGTRARSDVYCSFTRRPNHLNPDALRDSNEDHPMAWRSQFEGGAMADADCPAPCEVRVLDSQAGIFRVEPLDDPGGIFESTVLGYATGDSERGGDSPVHDMAKANRDRKDAFAQWSAARMDPGFFLCTVMTATVASPNDVRRFHQVEISASQANSTNAEGPPIYARVPAGVATARFAWDDAQHDAIIQAIQHGGQPPSGLLVNTKMVDEVSRATARAIYNSYSDVPLTSSGPVVIDMDPDRVPSGSIVEVRHGLRPPGVTVTEMTSSNVPRPVDITPYLPSWVRSQILKAPEG